MPVNTIKTERQVKVVVATTVMLSFISFWRAAAIVLNDLGSSAYYVGGIAEQAIGKAAPWFILGVMLFSYAVRAVYIESSDDALRIMYVTTVMVVMLILWAGYSILIQPEKQRLPPAPVPQSLAFSKDAVGWLPDIAPGALRELPPETPSASKPEEAET